MKVATFLAKSHSDQFRSNLCAFTLISRLMYSAAGLANALLPVGLGRPNEKTETGLPEKMDIPQRYCEMLLSAAHSAPVTS